MKSEYTKERVWAFLNAFKSQRVPKWTQNLHAE